MDATNKSATGWLKSSTSRAWARTAATSRMSARIARVVSFLAISASACRNTAGSLST